MAAHRKTFADVSGANSGAAVGGIIGTCMGLAAAFSVVPMPAVLNDISTAVGGGAVVGILLGAMVGMIIDFLTTDDT